MEPGLLSKTEFLPIQNGSWSPVDISDRIHTTSRSYRKDHCAVFIDSDSRDDFLGQSGLPASLLDPDENAHWTGLRRSKHSKLKSVVVGDYDEWFRWFMKWQRFNAFHTIVLIAPIRRMLDDDKRGYFDGLITRLLNRPSVHGVVVAEEERFLPAARMWMGNDKARGGTQELAGKFMREQFREAIYSLLYGTLVPKKNIEKVAASTLSAKVDSNWKSELDYIKARPSLVELRDRRFYRTGYHGREMVESLETPELRRSLEKEGKVLDLQPTPPFFKQAKDIGPSELSQEWLEGLAQSLLDSQGWFTIPGLYDHVQRETQRVIQTSETFPKIFNDHFDFELPPEKHVFLPNLRILRKIADKLVREGKLQTATWVREIGRPTVVYHLQGRLPFEAESRCGQCAFYLSLRRRCRVWWLLDKSYGYRNPRWSRDGARPLSAFEAYKMRNSWRIGPSASACSRFVDKKKDYTRRAFPDVCDICRGELPARPKNGRMVVCGTCRTRYFATRQNKVRVLTAYDHLFKQVYQDLAGVDPSSDIKRLIEDRQGSVPSIVEKAIYDEHRGSHPEDPDSTPKTVMLFPGETMLAKDGRLYIFKRRGVESIPLHGSTVVDHGNVVIEEQRGDLEKAGVAVRSVARPAAPDGQERLLPPRYDIAPAVEKVVTTNPEFQRKMVLAMAQSAVHATKRIGSLVGISDDDIRTFTSPQKLFIRRLLHVPPSRFLVYEAVIMKEYWSCYFLPLKAALQRFGPRKKARFVREFVADPVGRARGYTAVDAAINYLHQRRLFKARSTNVQLGLDFSPGEGFLHRKRWNPEGLGLVLDLIDPFKFADREKLLGAILDVSLNWRDFYSATDRHGTRFYYPKPEATGVLEGVGEAADQMSVRYGESQITLDEAYRRTVSKLIQYLQVETASSFTPFVF